jgi:NTP pyrophosphatase (non-canonical NTP hydrolase)
MSENRYARARQAFEGYAGSVDNAAGSVSYAQAMLARWQATHFGAPSVMALTLGVCEEAGELAHATLKAHQGIRGFDDPARYEQAAADAIGDICIYAAQLCTLLRLDFEEVFLATASHVLKRDWSKDPSGAGNG